MVAVTAADGKRKVESWVDPEARTATGTYNIAGPHFGVTQCLKTDKDFGCERQRDRETERRNGRI